MSIYIKGFHKIFGIKCFLCKASLPASPDYVNIDGEERPICNDCGDVIDAMNTMKTGDTSWMTK